MVSQLYIGQYNLAPHVRTCVVTLTYEKSRSLINLVYVKHLNLSLIPLLLTLDCARLTHVQADNLFR